MLKKIFLFFITYFLAIHCATTVCFDGAREFRSPSSSSDSRRFIQIGGMKKRSDFFMRSPNRAGPGGGTSCYRAGSNQDTYSEVRPLSEKEQYLKRAREEGYIIYSSEECAAIEKQMAMQAFECEVASQAIIERNTILKRLCKKLAEKKRVIAEKQLKLDEAQEQHKQARDTLDEIDTFCFLKKPFYKKEKQAAQNLHRNYCPKVKRYTKEVSDLDFEAAQIENKIIFVETAIQQEVVEFKKQLDVVEQRFFVCDAGDLTPIEQARREALEIAQAEHGKLHEVAYDLTEQTECFLKELEIPVAHFENGLGNALQNHIMQENVDIIQELACLHANHQEEAVTEYVQAAAYFSQAAIESNNAGQMCDAMRLTDVSRQFLDTVSWCVKTGGKTVVGLAKGTVKGMFDIIKAPFQILLHPVEFVHNLSNLGVFVCDVIDGTNPKARDQLYDACEHFASLPVEQRAEVAARLTTVFFGPGIIAKSATWQRCVQATTNIIGRELAGMQALLVVECAEIVDISGIKMPQALAAEILAAQKSAGRVFGKAEVAQRVEYAMAPVSSSITHMAEEVAGVARAMEGAEVVGGQEAVSIEQAEALGNLRPTHRPVYRTVRETGERCRLVRPKDISTAELEWAPLKYEEIRKCCNDVERISKNIGWAKHKIERIKNHLFHNQHVLRDGKMRFHPDPEVAAVWDRLYGGDFIKNDIKLLEHEFLELVFEQKFKVDYDTAHAAAKHPVTGVPWSAPKFESV